MQPGNSTDSTEFASAPGFLRWVIGIGLAFVAALVLLLVTTTERGVLDSSRPDTYGGDFTLTGQYGPVSLQDFRGKVVLLYFGFLNCPEVCPASMGVFQQTLSRLSVTELIQVQPLLVTIDPARDSARDVSDFGAFYHESIMGLSGSDDEIRAVANQYGAYYEAVDAEDPALDYVFEHTSRYYVIDQDGRLVDAMRHSTTSNELLARVRSVL
ncbi:MAG: SCO family protein [Pseudomonadota bacterium]